MRRLESCSELRGLPVITMEEGASLGTVYDIYIGSAQGGITGISFQEGLFGKVRFSPISNVYKVGEDFVFLVTKSQLQEVKEETAEKGESLRHLCGMWVTTEDGEHLGHLKDLDFEPSTWKVTGVLLSDGLCLQSPNGEVRYGKDEIVVTRELAQTIKRVSRDRKTGILQYFYKNDRAQPQEQNEQAGRNGRAEDSATHISQPSSLRKVPRTRRPHQQDKTIQ